MTPGFPKKNIYLLCFGMIGCILFSKSLAHDEILSLELKPSALLQKDVITLSDVAIIKIPSRNKGIFWGDIPIGAAPRVGYPEYKKRAELESLLKERIELQDLRLEWAGAKTISIRRQGQWLSANFQLLMVEQQLKDFFSSKCRDVVINPKFELRAIEVPEGMVTAQIRGLQSVRLRPRQSIWLDIVVNGKFYRAVQLPLIMNGKCKLYQAKRNLGDGEILAETDFVEEEVSIDQLPSNDAYVSSLPMLRRLNRMLHKGEFLRENDVNVHEGIVVGDKIKLIAISAGITIETTAIAQGNAKSGQTVRLKVGDSNESIEAKVVANGMAKIEER